MKQTKIEKLKAIKEEFARVQARLEAARKLNEAAEPTYLATLLENDLDQAELVLAAQDITTKLQEMAEDLAKINAQSLFPLVDKMKPVFGLEAAHQFEESAQEAITGAMDAVRHAKDLLGNAIIVIEGRMPTNDMASPEMAPTAPAPEMTGDEVGDDFDQAMDDFGSADGASGPEEEPLGRAKKESVQTTKPALTESVILKEAGTKLIASEGLSSLIDWVLTEAASAMPTDKFQGFAKSIANKAAEDPERLAGWIGKKKHGMAAMAQLAQPTMTHSPSLSMVEGELVEGKTYKRDAEDEEEDFDKFNKKGVAKDRRYARRSKYAGDSDVNEEAVTEKFKGDDDDVDMEDKHSKKGRTMDRRNARRTKYAGDQDVSEAHRMASAMAMMIEANILSTGKGKAFEVMQQFAEKTLSEGSEMTILEAFEDMFGMKPAAFSVMMSRELSEAMPALSSADKKNAAGVMANIAGKMSTDKAAGSKPVQAALQGMTGQERSTAQKMINNMKRDGKPAAKVSDFVAAGQTMIDGDDNDDAVNENINAAHWPTDTAGQYKGEPMSTDYNKLKAPKSTAAKTDTAPKAEKSSTAPAAKTAPKTEEASDEAPKAEKPKGNPFAKKEETSEEVEPKKVEESRKRIVRASK